MTALKAASPPRDSSRITGRAAKRCEVHRQEQVSESAASGRVLRAEVPVQSA